MGPGQIRYLGTILFDKNRGFMYRRIVFFHLLVSFFFLTAGFLMGFFGEGAGNFLFIFIVTVINFPGVKTVGVLFNGELSVFLFYVLSVLATSFYLVLLLGFFYQLRSQIKK